MKIEWLVTMIVVLDLQNTHDIVTGIMTGNGSDFPYISAFTLVLYHRNCFK